MEQHYSQASLERLLFGSTTEVEERRAARHLSRCERCWAAAVDVVASRSEQPKVSNTSSKRSLLLCTLEDEERIALADLKARGLWAELRELSPSEQVQRVRSTFTAQSSNLCEIMLKEAWSAASSDPHRTEQTAHLCLLIARLLPAGQARYRAGIEAEALTVVANCRRLAADWNG